MSKNNIEWSPDGCPNDCGYCKRHKLDCVYEVPKFECPVCHKKLFHNEIYDYKGFECCYDCLEKVKERVEWKIKEANENAAARHVSIHPEFWEIAKKDKQWFGPAIERASKESQFDKDLREGNL